MSRCCQNCKFFDVSDDERVPIARRYCNKFKIQIVSDRVCPDHEMYDYDYPKRIHQITDKLEDWLNGTPDEFDYSLADIVRELRDLETEI